MEVFDYTKPVLHSNSCCFFFQQTLIILLNIHVSTSICTRIYICAREGKEAKYLIHVYLRSFTGVTRMVP